MPIQLTRTINGVEQKIKWACHSCIHGHRSSKCEHFSQWMFQVATPGRPKVKCSHPEPHACPCKKKQRCLMVLVGRTAKGECLCQPFKSREESSLMVPPIVANAPPHQDPQMGMNHGHNPYGGFPNNGEISVAELASGNDIIGPPTGYQHSALGAFPPQPHPLQQPPQTISSQAAPPQAYPQQRAPWDPAQGYFLQPLAQGSAQAVHPSWSSPSSYHQAPPALNYYSGSTNMPIGQGYTHQHLGPTVLPTPEQTPPPTYESSHSHPHFSSGEQFSDWRNQGYHIQSPQPHPSGDQQYSLYQNSGANNNHVPVQGDSSIANDYHQPQDSNNFDPDASTDVFTQFTNCQQQEKDGQALLSPSTSNSPSDKNRVLALAIPGTEPSNQFTPSHDFADIPEYALGPQLANRQHSQHQNEMRQNVDVSEKSCQCGPTCNCVRCITHPTNPATMEWVQEMHDIMDEDLKGGSAPTSRPQSSYGQPSSALNVSGQDSESQMQDFASGFSPTLPTDWNSYSVLNYPISGCSNNADCRCGDNCRCEGCLTHSGHVKL